MVTEGGVCLDEVNHSVVGPGGERVNYEAIQGPLRGKAVGIPFGVV